MQNFILFCHLTNYIRSGISEFLKENTILVTGDFVFQVGRQLVDRLNKKHAATSVMQEEQTWIVCSASSISSS